MAGVAVEPVEGPGAGPDRLQAVVEQLGDGGQAVRPLPQADDGGQRRALAGRPSRVLSRWPGDAPVRRLHDHR